MTILAITWACLDAAFLAAWALIGLGRTRLHHRANSGGQRDRKRDRSIEHGERK